MHCLHCFEAYYESLNLRTDNKGVADRSDVREPVEGDAVDRMPA